MPKRKRDFTVEEAEQFKPALKKDNSKLGTSRKKLASLGGEMTQVFEIIRHNGGHKKTADFLRL